MTTSKLIVDGTEVEVPSNLTLLQACEMAGAEIPRFCYHERLSIAGNCRMCLVEVVGAPKPVASCAQQVRDLRPGKDGTPPQVNTRNDYVKRARNGVMEFLLINHPLDCPICDQGGECDLQDQSMAYGVSYSRYLENKRAVDEKYMGPLIKTIMTRCIHCTRCVRFLAEVGGIDDLGATGRGEDMEITTYLEHAIGSELSGNVIDLCPVGALTSAPYAFHRRPWELKKTETVDVMDAVGTNVRVDSFGPEVMRVMPRLHEDVNEEWLADRSRFIWDGLQSQRLDKPYVRRNGKLEPATWNEAFEAIRDALTHISPDRVAAIAGDLACTESQYALKQLMTSLNVRHLDCRQDGAKIGGGPREGYLSNTGIAGLEEADAVLLVGTDPRSEAPILNTRLRKAWKNYARIGLIGPALDLSYPYDHLGEGAQALVDVTQGNSPFSYVLKNAERPAIVVGMGALSRPDGAVILAECAQIANSYNLIRSLSDQGDGAGEAEPTPQEKGWNGFNVLHTAAGRAGGLDVGFLPQQGGRDLSGIFEGCESGDIRFVYLLNADEIDMAELGSAFVVYQGHHGDAGAHRADVILPGAAYTEKNALWVNTEGRVQAGRRAVFPPGEAKEDWAILRALSEVLGAKLPFDSLQDLRRNLFDDVPHLAEIDQRPAPAASAEFLGSLGEAGDMLATAFEPATAKDRHFFVTPIHRASTTMAACAKAASGGKPALSVAAE